MLNKIKNQKGVSIYLALIIMVIFLAMSFGLTGILLSQKKTIRSMEYSINALGAADSGIEYLLYLDKQCYLEDCSYVDVDCKPGCRGLIDGHQEGPTPLKNGAIYLATITKNCGLNKAVSTGNYQEAKRKIETNFGKESPGVRLNSATDKNCEDICKSFDCGCTSIGLNAGANDGHYWHTDLGPPCSDESGGSPITIMHINDDLCGSGGVLNLTDWTNCYCATTTP